MAQAHVAIYGPLPAQFERVVSKLPKERRKAVRFSLVTTDKDKRPRAPRADLHVLWTRFIAHVHESEVAARNEPTQWVHRFNAETLEDALRKGLDGEPDAPTGDAQSTPESQAPTKRRKRKRKK